MKRTLLYRIGALGIAASIVALLVSCDSGPKAGDVTASLATPHQELGSVMFKVTAVAPNTIEGLTAACSGCMAFMSRVSESEVRGIVTGPLGGGALVHVAVSDRRVPEAYSVVLLELARADYGLAALSGSSLQFPTQ